MKINEITDITRATPQNQIRRPAYKIEDLVDELQEESSDSEEVIDEDENE